MVKKFIPNFFTLCNMFCGSVAVFLAVQNHLVFAAIAVTFGIFFDFFDGFFARLLKVPSSLGMQLDSLADMITSGLAPGIVMLQLINRSVGGNSGSGLNTWEEKPVFELGFEPIALVGLLITLAAGYRLAKFNIDTRQTTNFIGLPTPANAILIMSLPLILIYQESPRLSYVLLNRWFLIGLTLFSSFIMNVELPLFGLKFKSWSFSENWYRYLFLIISIIALITLKVISLPIIILVYLLFNVILYFFQEEEGY